MFSMSAREQMELDIVVKVSSGQMNRKHGQQVLGVSERTMGRYLQEHDEKGVIFIKHGNCGNSPANRIDPVLKGKSRPWSRTFTTTTT